jgi:hypothetical protein
MGALRVLEGLLGALGVALLWFGVLFVLPIGIMLYVGLLFPLTGQWGQRWRDWRRRGRARRRRK